MKWNYKTDKQPQSFDEFKDLLMENRDISDVDAFFSPSSPLKLSTNDVGIDKAQFDIATTRINQAIDNQENVVVFGDYDADGVCSTVILWEALKERGLEARTFIPDRKRHGYGISQKAVEDIINEKKPDLIITVDNGIVAHDAIKWTMDQGVDVIITDHHQSEDTLPNAMAVIHTSQVCGAGVSWMLAKEISPDTAKESLDLVAIATVADLVPLIGASRDFVVYGLDMIQHSERLGLQELKKVSNLNKGKITSRSIGFGIGPRLNAMGRLDNAEKAVTLLKTNNKEEAQKLAELLEETNHERRKITIDLLEVSQRQLKIQVDEKDKISIVWNKDFHEGVVGLIAGKLVEKESKPAIVIHLGEDISKASARSLPGINVIEIIRQVKEHLIDAGGHPMAAGFSFKTENLDIVVSKLKEIASNEIDDSLLVKSVDIDCVLPYSLATEKFIDSLENFEPFGKNNPQPTLSLNNLRVDKVFYMGKNKQHIKLLASEKGSSNYKKISCIAWNKENLLGIFNPGDDVDVAGKLDINEWNGRRSVQIICDDIKFSK